MCPERQDALLECLAAVEDSKFEMCTADAGIELDIAAYYYCYDPFIRWLSCE
jgi:hypothetical protein